MNTQEKSNNQTAANAEILGEAFHNPYTFIPFPQKVIPQAHVPITSDDNPEEGDYWTTGVLELEIETLSPLMTCSPNPIDSKAEHKSYPALAIGNDVILPASGIRGSLRTLMTILSGGTLGYLDEHLWLAKPNDVRLGPSEKDADVPDKVFLAKVVKPGSSTQPGVIELGDTKLKKEDELLQMLHQSGALKGKKLEDYRPTNQRKPTLMVDGWEVKLSGKPVNKKGKREGMFRGNGVRLEIPEHYWLEYQGKHRHAVVDSLKAGDLIWLEPSDVSLQAINRVEDIKSFQWSRWGRGGRKLKDALPHISLVPDSHRNRENIDWVTDLFGFIPHPNADKSPRAFAARIKPGNLVFLDATDQLTRETLAPMGAPHPACSAFYNDIENLDEVDGNGTLRGYKVYRNTTERGDQAPWKASVQGAFDESGRIQANQKQKMNKTVELLNQGQIGKLKISLRSLDPDDMALLYAACTVDWKLGGGKPLGLGHCRVKSVTLIMEDGERRHPLGERLPDSNFSLTEDQIESMKRRVADFEDRYELYKTAQIAVDKLRYPRAVDKNNNKNSRSGLQWFSRHATVKKSGTGLETIWTDGQLKQQSKKSQIRAQPLPPLVAGDPNADQLYGYDVVNSSSETVKQRKYVKVMEPFDAAKHISGREKSGENSSQNATTREDARKNRE